MTQFGNFFRFAIFQPNQLNNSQKKGIPFQKVKLNGDSPLKGNTGISNETTKQAIDLEQGVEQLRELDEGDYWLIYEVAETLIHEYNYSEIDVAAMIDNSNIKEMILKYPEQAHHDTPRQWALKMMGR